MTEEPKLTKRQMAYAANRDAAKVYYKKNVEERLAYQKEYAEANREKIKEYQRLYRLRKTTTRLAV